MPEKSRRTGCGSVPTGTSIRPAMTICPPTVVRPGTGLPARRPPARDQPLGSLERRHHVLGEPAELLLEFLGRNPFGPVDHEVLETGIFRRDRLDAVNHLRRWAAEPRPLRNAVLQRGRARGRAGRAPDTAVLVGIAHEAERREPLEALVMRGLEPAHRLLAAVGEIDAGAPDHVLAQLLLAAVLATGRVVGAHHVVEDFLAVEGHHRLQTVLRHQLDGLAAR